MVESIVDPGELHAAAEEIVGVQITLRDNLNREDGIFAGKHLRIPFGEHHPSAQVHHLRVQAQHALQRAQGNLVTQTVAVRKLIDSILAVIGEYEGVDASAEEQLKQLTARLTEIEGQAP